MHLDGSASLPKIRHIGLRTLVIGALVAGFVVAVTPTAEAIGPNAIRTFAGTSTLSGNDDGSTAAVSIGFPINYYGARYSSLYVNNNGNLTFDAPYSQYTPVGLVGPAMKIIAPFFADVDTRAAGSHLVTYGQGTVDGHPAFAATWPGVGCYSENISVLDYFQVVLIDRSDTGAENFDIEFNYDQIQWDAGQASGGNTQCTGSADAAHVGYSNGIASDSFELPGSGVNGAFLDGGPHALASNDLNSTQLGRYVFPIRTVPTTMTGTLADGTNSGAALVTTVGTSVTDSAVLSGQTATAGGSVTYRVYSTSDCSGPATVTSVKTVSNGAVPASDPFSLPPGIYQAVATYTGDSHNRGSATACGDQVLTVYLHRLTITAQDQTVTYGDPDPEFSYTVSGLVGSDELTTAPTCGVPGAHTAAGAYAIICSGADAGPDYAVTYQPGTLTITPAPTTLEAHSAPVGLGVVGLRLQVGSLSATLRAGSANAPVSGQPVVFSVGSTRLCTATTGTSGVGTCPITLLQQLQVVSHLGFIASFAGSHNLLPSTDRAGLIGPI